MLERSILEISILQRSLFFVSITMDSREETVNARASHYSAAWCTRTMPLCSWNTFHVHAVLLHRLYNFLRDRTPLPWRRPRSFCPLARAREYSFFCRIDSTHATTSFTHATAFFDPVRLFFSPVLLRFYDE